MKNRFCFKLAKSMNILVVKQPLVALPSDFLGQYRMASSTFFSFSLKKMDPTKNTKPVAATDKSEESHEERGETFWILVYVFMAFAIFEVLCVALFFIYRHRRKRREKRYDGSCMIIQ